MITWETNCQSGYALSFCWSGHVSSFFDRIVQMFLDGFFKYLLCLLVVKVLSLVTLFNPLKSQKYLVSLCCVLKTLVVSD